MAYDEKLAARVERAIKAWPGCTSRKNFGGLGFLLHGNLCVAVRKNDLLVRCAPADTDELLARKHVTRFKISGRPPMKGWLVVAGEGVASDAALTRWLGIAHDFVRSLPPK